SGEGVMVSSGASIPASGRPFAKKAVAESEATAPGGAHSGSRESKIAGSLRDAAVAAFITGVLGLFFIGLRTDIAPGGLDLTMRWGAWFVSILVVFAGRLALNLLVFRADNPLTEVIGTRFSGA